MMDLSLNMFNASIPSCFKNFSSGTRQYDVEYNPMAEWFSLLWQNDISTSFTWFSDRRYTLGSRVHNKAQWLLLQKKKKITF